MKNILQKTIFLLSILSSMLAVSQGSIQSVVPNAALPGQVVEIVIRGSNTAFQVGAVSVDLGADVFVQQVSVNNSYTLVVSAQIMSNANPGFRNISVVSSGNSLEMINAFEIITSGGSNVMAILEINPVQVLYASDFSPDNLANAPFLFRVTVLNDQQSRNLSTYFYLLLEGEGLLLTAIKNHPETPAGAVLTFDNREFDEFEFNDQKSNIVSQIMATGVLPPGIYTYRIEVRQGNQVLASSDGQNTLLNQAGDLVMISPGSAMDGASVPIDQLASQPLFQWISSANQYDLFLYEVVDGQTNAQEITQQLPIYREFAIIGNSFLYPLSAEPLKEGSIYAWQIRAYFNNPGGNGYFEGPVYWFAYGPNTDADVSIGSLKIIPNYLELKTTSTNQFIAEIIDADGNTLNVKPTWTVLPNAQFGSIDENGFFTAGQYPMFGAVQVSYGERSTHCVVELKFAGLNFLNGLFRNGSYKVRTEE